MTSPFAGNAGRLNCEPLRDRLDVLHEPRGRCGLRRPHEYFAADDDRLRLLADEVLVLAFEQPRPNVERLRVIRVGRCELGESFHMFKCSDRAGHLDFFGEGEAGYTWRLIR